jgi:YaiO family outer membrane protein
MKILISIICLICLFSCIYGQNMPEILKNDLHLKSNYKVVSLSIQNSKPEIEKELTLNPQTPEDEQSAKSKRKKKRKKTEEKADQKHLTEIQINANYEVLTKKSGTWKSVTLNVRHDFSRRQVLYGFYQKSYRNLLRGETATIGLYEPLSRKFTILLETSTRSTGNFLPKWSGLVQIETKVTPTTFVNLGYRHTIYQDAKLNIINAGVEKYWKNYRFTYNMYLAGKKEAEKSLSNRIQIDRYYGENSSTISTDVAFGNEIQSIFSDNKILKSNFTSFSIGGKHWINKQFGINYNASFLRQEKFYSRGGTTLGAIFRF